MDLLPNQPKNDEVREFFRSFLRKRFEGRLEESAERIYELPPMIVKDPAGDYFALLREARDLFVAGCFYSCVAMCGIVGERLVKDFLPASILVERGDGPERPSDEAFDQLERVEVWALVQFLKKTALLSDDAAKAWQELGTLRNKYAHARGKDPQPEALEAIQYLHTLVEGTVSVFKDHEIKEGVFAKKAKPAKGGAAG